MALTEERTAATTGEPVAWALRWPDGRVTHSGASPLTTQELAVHRPEATVIPLYDHAPQVAALTKGYEAMEHQLGIECRDNEALLQRAMKAESQVAALTEELRTLRAEFDFVVRESSRELGIRRDRIASLSAALEPNYGAE